VAEDGQHGREHDDQRQQQPEGGQVALEQDAVAGDRVGKQRLDGAGFLAAADRPGPGADAEHHGEQRPEGGEQPCLEVAGRRGQRDAGVVPGQRLDGVGQVGEELVNGGLPFDGGVQGDRERTR
jgi:hypothetical protein